MAYSTCEQPSMCEEDWTLFRQCTWRFDSRRVENLRGWASKNMKSGTYNCTFLRESDSLYGESWDLITRLLEFSSPGRAVTMAKELRSKGPITWNTDLAIYMSNISSNTHWSHVSPPAQVLTSIIEDLSPTNGLVRYNTEAISIEERRWWTGRHSEPAVCEKDRLRELYGAAVEHSNVLRTELTQINRTADLFQKRNCL